MAQLKDLIVNGASRLIGDTTVNKIQITSLSAPTSAGGTTYGLGTSGNILKTNGSSVYWGTLNVSDLTNDTGFITGLYVASYGNSTYADVLAAYQANKVVYCRASSNANPSSGEQKRLAFLAYVNYNTTPTEFEFQYYRSVATHSDSQQGDQVFVYKLNSSTGWSVTTREASSKVTANNGLTTAYNNNTITISHANTAITAQSTQAVYPIAIDAYGHITGYGTSPTTLSGYGITDAKIASGVITLGSNTITPKTVQTAVTKPTAATNKWVSAIGQNTNGVIDVSYATLDTSGTWSGNAATATKLATPRTISLTGSVTGSGSFDGSGNLNITTTTNHNHDTSYVLKAGDTMTGSLTISTAAQPTVIVQDTGNNNLKAALLIGSGHQNHGLYSYGYAPTASTYTSDAKWIIYRGTDGEAHSQLKIYGAVWNDYAEYRITQDIIEPGYCIIETGNDDLVLSTSRMQPGAEIVSDTFGFAIGQTKKAQTPIASSGRVLAYLYEGREAARTAIGKPVCSGPNGTVSIMTDEEYQKYGYCAIGTISAVPDYEEWGEDNIKVNGRVWIRIR